MSWEAFGQAVLLIIIYVLVKQFIRCMHDSHCKKCKPQ